MLNTNKIIDAHVHFVQEDHFAIRAQAAGHVASSAHLLDIFKKYNIVQGIAMGTYNIEPANDSISYPRTINLAGDFSLVNYTNLPKFFTVPVSTAGLYAQKISLLV